jgi:hypothetical protein
MNQDSKISHRLNLFVERIIANPNILARYRAEPDAVLGEFGIVDEKVKVALLEGGFENILPLQLHPILAMHYQLALNPEVASHMTINYYPELKVSSSKITSSVGSK